MGYSMMFADCRVESGCNDYGIMCRRPGEFHSQEILVKDVYRGKATRYCLQNRPTICGPLSSVFPFPSFCQFVYHLCVLAYFCCFVPLGEHSKFVPRPLVVAGPSGSGKSTLLKQLFDEFPQSFGFSVSRKFCLETPTHNGTVRCVNRLTDNCISLVCEHFGLWGWKASQFLQQN